MSTKLPIIYPIIESVICFCIKCVVLPAQVGDGAAQKGYRAYLSTGVSTMVYNYIAELLQKILEKMYFEFTHFRL